MSIRTLGLSGLDRDEEKLFRQLFEALREPGWALAAEDDAGVLIIDFDSMYGQMAWLRAQDGPRTIVALTAGARADATHVLKRPVSEKALRDLLRRLVSEVPEVESEARGEVPESAVEAIEAPPPEPVVEPRARVMLDYLQPGLLAGPARLRDSDPPLAIDVTAGTYLGGTALKPLAVHCARSLEDDDWEPLSASEYAALAASLGKPQPLARLSWLAGLSGFDGQLGPELAGSVRFKLSKWPQTEREYPRQFRIATALLKQLSTVDELAAASGASPGEVADYINACHAIGMIEHEGVPAPQAPEPPARGGLLGRLRRG